jgi:hypothetical protein
LRRKIARDVSEALAGNDVHSDAMLLLFSIASVALAGSALADRTHIFLGPNASGPFQRLTWSGIAGFALAVSATWLLAALHLLSRAAVTSTSAAFLVGAAGYFWFHPPRTLTNRTFGVEALAWIGASVVIAGFVTFALWRGQYISVYGNDALAYHLPRAAMFLREHGFASWNTPDPRLSTWPCNYELLLASLFALDGTDIHSSVISVLSWSLLICSAGAVAEQWWGPGIHSLAGVALTAAVPVALLHAPGQKNDLMMSFFFVAGILGASQYCAHGSRPSLLGCGVAAAMALGTKVNGLFLIVGVTPLVLSGIQRHVPSRARLASVMMMLGVSTLLMVSLGGAIYVVNTLHGGSPLGLPARVTAGGYGDWANLLRFPSLLALVPFSDNANGIRSPFDGNLWFWQRYDMYSSHLGGATSLMVLLLPVRLLLRRRRTIAVRNAVEQWGASLATLLAFLLVAPIRLLPEGFFCTFSRFVIFVVPVVSAWTVVPLVAELCKWRMAAGVAVVLALWGNCVSSMFLYMANDIYAPLAWVEREATRQRQSPRFGDRRACTIVDRVAAPDAAVLIDGDFDSWIYACWGRTWSRRVSFREGGRTAVPDGIKWVAIDRPWGKTWNHPEFVDFGHFFEFIQHGTATPDETIMFEELSKDPRYRLVFQDPKLNQAVFERTEASPSAPGLRRAP